MQRKMNSTSNRKEDYSSIKQTLKSMVTRCEGCRERNFKTDMFVLFEHTADAGTVKHYYCCMECYHCQELWK
jgi:hypothetical protein